MADLTTRVGAVSLATPIIAASGTYGYGCEYADLVDWSRVGGVAVKGLSIEPSGGHVAPRMVETPAGMLNAIGLQNIGVARFAEEKLPETLFPWFREPIRDALNEAKDPIRRANSQGPGDVLAAIRIDLRMRISDNRSV